MLLSAIISPLAVLALAALSMAGGESKLQSEAKRDLALKYLREAEALCQKDGGRLWGISLAGPLIFVEPKTRRVYANQADPEGKLKQDGEIYVGELPAAVHAANYSVKWAGVQWTMVIWPLPEDANDRRVLLMHESWHRIQSRLGFPPTGPENPHLDTFDGRYWLQLEWRALARALSERGEGQRHAILDALMFRQHRRNLCQNSARSERELEMHEGLAQYSGVALSGLSEEQRRLYVVKLLERMPAEYPSFPRSFAYLSGPAYGLLLDQAQQGWRKAAKPRTDLGEMLRAALELTLPELDKEALVKRAESYDGERLLVKEKDREQTRLERQASLRKRFVDGPVLLLPLKKPNMLFNPNTLEPLDGVGTHYPTMRLTDLWGAVEVTGGAVRTNKSLLVTAPKDTSANPLKGDGWELKLSEGWRIVPGMRPGDFQLELSMSKKRE